MEFAEDVVSVHLVLQPLWRLFAHFERLKLRTHHVGILLESSHLGELARGEESSLIHPIYYHWVALATRLPIVYLLAWDNIVTSSHLSTALNDECHDE